MSLSNSGGLEEMTFVCLRCGKRLEVDGQGKAVVAMCPICGKSTNSHPADLPAAEIRPSAVKGAQMGGVGWEKQRNVLLLFLMLALAACGFGVFRPARPAVDVVSRGILTQSPSAMPVSKLTAKAVLGSHP